MSLAQTPIAVGDTIVHRLVPDFRMKVLEIEPCPDGPNAGEHPDVQPHDSYRIIDPEGNEDWLCGHDVRKVGS